MTTTSVDLSHLSPDDLMQLRRHLRAMLIMVEQLLTLTAHVNKRKG